MAADDLSIILFFAGLAVTFVVTAVTQAGWKHRALISLLFLLAAASGVTAIAWPFAKNHTPLVADYIKQVAANPVAWFIVLMFALVIATLPLWQGANRTQGDSGASPLRPNTLRDALDIEYGAGELYNKLEINQTGIATRIIRLRLINRGNGLLTQCMLKLKATVPAVRHQGWISLPVSLVPGEYQFVYLATYQERNETSDLKRDVVTICQAYGGGFAAPPTHVVPPAVTAPMLLTVVAEAAECGPKEAHFKLWVDQPASRLRIEVA